MKKIMNKPEHLVAEMCSGLVLAHPELAWNEKYKVVKKKTLNPDKVTLISGGGSGHEPAHAGFIGVGMLDAAVCGDVFASPSQVQVYQAIKETAGNKGTLLIIKNYSGDMMNFQNAAYLAEMDGLQVDYVKVDDDIAVEDSLYTVGRRGVAGTVLVHKIAGAAAEAGLSLADVKAVGERAAANVRSLGFALTSCTVPAKGSPTFTLAEDEMEYGVGIHGEPGRRRQKLVSADELAADMTSALLADLGVKNQSDEEVVLLINGFGATPLQELYLFNHAVMKQLHHRGIKVCRIFVGNYMTSIDMAGASLTVMKLDEEQKHYLSAPSAAPGFPVSGPVAPPVYQPLSLEEEEEQTNFQLETKREYGLLQGNQITLENMIYLVDKMSEVIISNEIPFCALDAHAGDGDFGMSVAKGFKQVKREWQHILEQGSDIGQLLSAVALVVMEHCGGASGPIWGFAFQSAGRKVKGKKALNAAEFAELLQAAVEGIQTAGARSFGRGAVVGDKTLIDALVPCADSWTASGEKGESLLDAFRKGAEAAVNGAKETEKIAARMGRAGTVGERSIGYPDAGAHALGVIFTQLTESLEER